MRAITALLAKTIHALGGVIATLIMGTAIMSHAVAADIPAIYNSSCAACHDSGALNAPKKGDKVAWDTLKQKKGMPVLLNSVKSGMIQMPAGGLCEDCNDDSYRKLIEYMSK
ncbi:cytochrome c5 family protein [Psychrobacter frigidicola]|uniref:Cytochrome c5 family protein n=1 Tax=Psychrobacter frigidicola TaxID=45611 RepID=A0A5C7A1B7_9GAMM|nr:c-type cytochrome [Psychrobacter frigidicola]TXD97036.1 cytochrome c5 family protein [Psychrobacter frigidicola]